MSLKHSSKAEFPGQHEGEDVEMVFRQHPIVMRKPLIASLMIVAASELPIILLPPEKLNLGLQILGGGVVVGLIVMFYFWIGWYYSVYILTDSRLIDIQQHGFFNRKVSEVGLDKIQTINYHIKGLQAVIFKFGDISMQTMAGGSWEMKNVHHPVEVHSKMIDVIRTAGGSASTGLDTHG